MSPNIQSAPTKKTWEGAKPNAWSILATYWALGAAAGLAGYWGVLVKGIQALPHIASMDLPPSRLVLALAVAATIFLKAAYIWSADRKGRGLSLFSLAVFPLATAVCESFLLLFIFDAGRWLLAAEGQGVVRGSVAVPALTELGYDSPFFFRQFMMGFIPYTLFYAAAWSYLWESWTLPAHMNPDAPNVFMRAIVVQQFSLAALYWATGDVVTMVAIRYVAELLTVLAVRMPPPGAVAPKAKKA